MLLRYLERRYAQAGQAEQQAFARLLELPDPQLQALLLGPPPGGGDAALRDAAQRVREQGQAESA